MIYLDTHVVLWLYQKELQLFSPTALELIDNSELHISPILMLELEYLFEIGRTKKHGHVIVDYLAKQIDLKIAQEKFETIARNALTIKWTRDPFDRLITAHASLANHTLITNDENILANYNNAIW